MLLIKVINQIYKMLLKTLGSIWLFGFCGGILVTNEKTDMTINNTPINKSIFKKLISGFVIGTFMTTAIVLFPLTLYYTKYVDGQLIIGFNSNPNYKLALQL